MTNEYPIIRDGCLYANPDTAQHRREPIAIRTDEACHVCGKTAPCWEIDSSGWEYSGTSLCRSCLSALTAALPDPGQVGIGVLIDSGDGIRTGTSPPYTVLEVLEMQPPKPIKVEVSTDGTVGIGS